jgi:hypothetical protein
VCAALLAAAFAYYANRHSQNQLGVLNAEQSGASAPSRTDSVAAEAELKTSRIREFVESDAYRQLLIEIDAAMRDGRPKDVFVLTRPHMATLDPVLESRRQAAILAVAEADAANEALRNAYFASQASGERSRTTTPSGAAFQKWACSGSVRSIEIWLIPGDESRRRVRTTYSDGSASEDDVPWNSGRGRTTYLTDPERRSLMHVVGTSHIEFWEDGEPIPGDVFTTCTIH